LGPGWGILDNATARTRPVKRTAPGPAGGYDLIAQGSRGAAFYGYSGILWPWLTSQRSWNLLRPGDQGTRGPVGFHDLSLSLDHGLRSLVGACFGSTWGAESPAGNHAFPAWYFYGTVWSRTKRSGQHTRHPRTLGTFSGWGKKPSAGFDCGPAPASPLACRNPLDNPLRRS